MKGCVYIIKRVKTGEYYIGSSCDPYSRLELHNAGHVKATRHKKPYKLVFIQEFENIKTAKLIERKIKTWKRKDFIDKIVRQGKIKISDNLGP